jgi:hypothetical protein
MERLLTVKDVMERYQCCRQTASRIIRQVPHIEDPHLMTYESYLRGWEQRQMNPKVTKIQRRA